jgi:glutamate 5-kinase
MDLVADFGDAVDPPSSDLCIGGDGDRLWNAGDSAPRDFSKGGGGVSDGEESLELVEKSVMKRQERWVIKIGSGVLSDPRGRLDHAHIKTLVDQIAKLHRQKIEPVIVTSGAVAAGMGILGVAQRPKVIQDLQACAAIGQPQLMRVYEELLQKHRLHAAQILLTYFDLDSRKLFANAQKTIQTLIGHGSFVPIINENDVVSYEEIKFGDNDRLSAEVAIMVKATRLVILSNIEGLSTRQDGKGELIPVVKKVDASIEALAGKTSSQTSVGGMISKLTAAKLVAGARIPMWIANGRRKNVLVDLAAGKKLGTHFLA